MREAIGGTWLFQIVVVFVLLFAAYMALSLNLSKAHAVKNEVVRILEREKGLYGSISKGSGSVGKISKYLNEVGYRTTGVCVKNGEDATGWYGLNQNSLVAATPGSKHLFCIKQISPISKDAALEIPYTAYYRIKVFFNLDLPIFSNAFNLTVSGDTVPINYPAWNVSG